MFKRFLLILILALIIDGCSINQTQEKQVSPNQELFYSCQNNALVKIKYIEPVNESGNVLLKYKDNEYLLTKTPSASGEKYLYPKKPTPTTKWRDGWHKRIGQLMPERTDHWWCITSSTDLRSLSKEVITAIEIYGLPEIQERIKSA